MRAVEVPGMDRASRPTIRPLRSWSEASISNCDYGASAALGSWPSGLGYVEQYLYKGSKYRQEPCVFTSTPNFQAKVQYVLRR